MSKIGRNEKCPCGSGKKYKKCCMGNEVEKAIDTDVSNVKVIGTNYKGDDIMLNLDTIDKSIDSIQSLAISSFFYKNRKKKSLKVEEGLSVLKEFYKILDTAFGEIYKCSTCIEKCNYCCNELVEVYPIEAEFINREYKNDVATEFVEKTNLELKEYCNKTPDFYEIANDEKVKMKYFDSKVGCAFLDKLGLCNIYKIRPYNCRKLFSYSSTDLCKEQSQRMEYRGTLLEESEKFLINLSLAVYGEKFVAKDKALLIKPLPHWFEEGLTAITF